jgi:L-amino acid N-acyltransferase YncA
VMGQVRVASAADAEAVAAIYAPYVLGTAISFEEEPPSAAEMADRISSTLQTHPVFEEVGQVIGYAYASPHAARPAYRWSCNVTAYAAPDAHRKGVGRALYAELLGLLERQRFHSVFAGIALPNAKSIGLHEAMGFAYLGVYRDVGFKLGGWHDVGWWSRSLGKGRPTEEPIPFRLMKV